MPSALLMLAILFYFSFERYRYFLVLAAGQDSWFILAVDFFEICLKIQCAKFLTRCYLKGRYTF